LIPNARALGLALLIGLTAARAETPRAVHPSAIWIDVPYFHQPREGCGAASLAMVMAYWAGKQGEALGAEGDVATIQHELYSPRDHGITNVRLAEYLRRHGFQVFALNGGWSDLEQQLRKGRPLIVALRPRGQKELHYVVVDGIDLNHGLVTVNDPAERKLLTRERAGFEKEWSATHNWMLLALPVTGSP
jgi:ABC-type bacteriocin/lantibiotic exporter with double-glycine peptidase domain